MDALTGPELEATTSRKQIAREEFILRETAVGGGRGGLAALRLAAKVLGPKICLVNAAGCCPRLATLPYSPCIGLALHTTHFCPSRVELPSSARLMKR